MHTVLLYVHVSPDGCYLHFNTFLFCARSRPTNERNINIYSRKLRNLNFDNVNTKSANQELMNTTRHPDVNVYIDRLLTGVNSSNTSLKTNNGYSYRRFVVRLMLYTPVGNSNTADFNVQIRGTRRVCNIQERKST